MCDIPGRLSSGIVGPSSRHSFGEFRPFRQLPIRGINSPPSSRNIEFDLSPFDNEITSFISRLSRRIDASDDEKTGPRSTHVLEKQSHLCYEIQPPCGDLEEDFENGAAM